MNSPFSIVLVSYNCKYFLSLCLEKLTIELKGKHAEIIVVDNASNDGVAEMLRENFPAVILIGNDENLGFSKANNIGILKASHDLILLLNPDTLVEWPTLETSIASLNNDGYGAVGCRMIDGIGNYLPESKRGFPGLWNSFCRFSGLASTFPNSELFAGYYSGNLKESENNSVEVLSGAYLFFNRKKLGKDFLLDERFFMFGEDIDFSYRVILEGQKNLYLGRKSIIHFKGESSNKASKAYLDNFYGAMKLFFEKYDKSRLPFLRTLVFSSISLLQGMKQKKPVAIIENIGPFNSKLSDPAALNALSKVLETEEAKVGGWVVLNALSDNLVHQVNELGKIGGLSGVLFWSPNNNFFLATQGKDLPAKLIR